MQLIERKNVHRTDYDVDFYVTGSNSRMMSSEIATYLTGRYVSFRIYTLSFQEYLEFKKQYTQVKDIHAELADYIRLGGFPATHLREYSQDEVYTIVRDIYNSTIFSDIVKRNQIRKIDHLPTLTPPNEPLTLEELREMNEEPVWIQNLEEPAKSQWRLLYWDREKYLVLQGISVRGYLLEEYGESWLAYRRPPEGEENA